MLITTAGALRRLLPLIEEVNAQDVVVTVFFHWRDGALLADRAQRPVPRTC
jgi:hypothetical protein